MRRLLIVLLAITVTVSTSYAGALTSPDDSGKVEQNVVYAGPRYDDGFVLTVGYGRSLGDNLWLFGYGERGNDATDGIGDLAYFKSIGESKFSIGFLVGGGTSRVQVDDEPSVTYALASTGLILAYRASSDFGFAGWFKYKTDADKDNGFDSHGSFGLAAWMGI